MTTIKLKKKSPPKVKCLLCDYKHHILMPHLKKRHGLTVLEYVEAHPEAPWFSAYGKKKMLEEREDLGPKLENRERKSVEVSTLFPEWSIEGASYEDTIDVYTNATDQVPTLNEAYVFPEEQTLEVLTVLEKPHRNNIYISGESGTGKSELCRNLAAKLNAELYQANLDRYQTRVHLFGGTQYDPERGTYFQYGIVPTAMMKGAWLVFHEWDTADPALSNILKPILEDNAQLTLTENGGEVITAHPSFRVLVTCNTRGRGDDSGQFINTEVQSVADLRRFNAFIELNWLSPEIETQVIKRQVPDLYSKDKLITKFLAVANATRQALSAGTLDRALSTAEVINWCENYILFGSAHRAARISFLRSYEPDVSQAVAHHIENAFGHEDVEEF